MTATRIVRTATLLAATAAWVFVAALLWRTTVPAHLRLPHVNEDATFGGAGFVRDAWRFERLLDWNWIAATVALLAAYAAMARRGRGIAARLGLGPTNAGIILGLLTISVVWAVGLPFDLVAAWWERRHGISHEGYAAVLRGAWATLLFTSATAFLALAIVLLLARRVGRRWWMAAGPALAVIVAGFQFVDPFVTSMGTHPVRSQSLRSEIATLERREQAGHPIVRVENVSGRTSEANAFAVGFGPSAHVILWNTLLDGSFTRNQVRFVIAHEFGHVARWHVLRGVAWFALLVLPVLAVAAYAADVRRPAAVPVALLVITVAQLVLLPLQNEISRRYEAEADWFGLNGTRDAKAASGLFVGLAHTSFEDPNPPAWAHVLLDDHPTLLQRVEMTRVWETRNR